MDRIVWIYAQASLIYIYTLQCISIYSWDIKRYIIHTVLTTEHDYKKQIIAPSMPKDEINSVWMLIGFTFLKRRHVVNLLKVTYQTIRK